MRDRIVSILVAVFASVSAIGCANLDPPYKTSALVFDDGWLGTWEVAAPAKSDHAEKRECERFVVEERVLDVDGDRIRAVTAPMQPHVGDAKTKQYVVRFELHEENVHGAEFNAFLLSVGDARLVAMQLSSIKIGEHWQPVRALAPLVLPVQFVFKVERRGDQMFAWTPNQHVVWIPWVQPFVSPTVHANPRPTEVLESRSGLPLLQALSVDQLLEHYTAVMDQPQAWEPDMEGKPVATRQARGSPPTSPK